MAHAGGTSGAGADDDAGRGAEDLRSPYQGWPQHRCERCALYGTHLTRLTLVFLTSPVWVLQDHRGRAWAVLQPVRVLCRVRVGHGGGLRLLRAPLLHVRTIALLVLPIAAGMLLLRPDGGGHRQPLVPAPAEQSCLLTIHVAVAIVAYGAFAISFAAAVFPT